MRALVWQLFGSAKPMRVNFLMDDFSKKFRALAKGIHGNKKPAQVWRR